MPSRHGKKGKRQRLLSSQRRGWERGVQWAIAVLALAGLAVSSYLTYLQYSGAEAAFCTQGSGCDLVRASGYSHLFGIPVALVGVLGYAAILLVSVWPVSMASKRFPLFLMALTGFTFSAYLTYLELAVIKAICFYCVVSAVLITVILVTLLLYKPLAPNFRPRWLALYGSLVVAVVLVSSTLGPSTATSDQDEEEFRVALAKHLTSEGAIMYGAWWCPSCEKQKELFGDAFSYIDYVECDPRGDNPRPFLCREMDIEFYPTWQIRGKFYEGRLSLGELAELSEFPSSESKGSVGSILAPGIALN